MSGNRIFVDTNILVYAHDTDAGVKHRLARERITELWQQPHPPIISIQVLQEFFTTLLRRGIATAAADEIVRNYLLWEVVDNDSTLFREGLAMRQRYQMSPWDAWIVAAAIHAKADSLWSEDLATGQHYDKVLVVNPLLDRNK